MKFAMKQLAVAALVACGAFALSAQTVDGVRNIKINEDRDQKWMVSKVYELKNISSDDITPWIQGAVLRYNNAGSCQALNYNAGNKQFIVVTTGKDMMPFVDAIVATMDRPCGKADGEKSIVDGTGIYKYAYRPKYRANDAMITTVLADTRTTGYGWYESTNNLFYWKDSKSAGDCVLQWMKAIDRPVPQTAVTINVYEINENDFKELGVDWLAWKNGPGANLFGTGYDLAKWDSVADLGSSTMSSFGGFMVAPQFNTTYLRMLAEKGVAKTSTSASITLVSDYNEDPANFAAAKYRIKFDPNYQYISMDANRSLSVASDTNSNIQLYFKKPTICFGAQGDKMNVIRFGWDMTVSQALEQANTTGNNTAYNTQAFRSYTTLAAGTEKLLATYVKDQKVTQNTGMPYLSDIPILKYLTGSTSASISHNRVFITVKAEPVLPSTDLSPWAGKVIEAAQLPPVEK